MAGPVLATTSLHDRAVRTFYPIGAGARDQVAYGTNLPTYGGVGVWGVRGSGLRIVDDLLPVGGKDHDLRPGVVLNLDASDVINVGSGPSGAHSDICHPEVARSVWQVVRVAVDGEPRTG